MKINTEKRFSIILIFIIVLFVVLFFRIGYMTLVKGDEYYTSAENKVYKKIQYEAPRGEIRDRNGVLLAGSRPSFTVEISGNDIDKDDLNNVAQKIMEILRQNNETVIDEFPIIFGDGQMYFSFDKKVSDWKANNDIDENQNANESFYTYAYNLQEKGAIEIVPADTSLDIQKKINDAGFYPPISVGKWKFIEQVKKEEWLAKYKIKEVNISPEDAYQSIRKSVKLDAALTNEQAREILIVVDLLKSKGYLQYEPSTLAMDISQKTIALIEESAVNLPGIAVKIIPIRYYPFGNFASHILGQIGKISTAEEVENYIRNKGYAQTDIIGKTGIENRFESVLKGENGFKRVQVDATGRLINSIDSKDPVSGGTVYLTIDSKLQKKAEESLEKTLNLIQTGGTYPSQWGDLRLRTNKEVFSKAESGAVVALDVNTGEVLALASYPDYDPNIFSRGITPQEFEKLTPTNNNPLAPKPLYNIATLTAVQPGSTFKMLTGLAALESGLDPYMTIKCDGFVMEGGRPFRCWIYPGKHGHEDLIAALRDSCNYYFYCISVGYNYFEDKPLPIVMGPEKILDIAKRFGLDEKTGIQIEENAGKVPNKESKLRETKNALYLDINNKMKDYFVDISNTNPLYEERINTIVSWIDENPSRGEILKRMKELNVKPAMIEEITDHVKYSYFNVGNWNRGDTFNLAIGQGGHAYTPIQIANYISAIANNGNLNKVTVVDKVVPFGQTKEEIIERSSTKIQMQNNVNFDIVKRGMLDVTDEGSVKNMFQNFPVKVASKTGTAEKSGKIPAEDEEAYLLAHLRDFGLRQDAVLEKAKEYEQKSTEKLPFHRYIRMSIKELNKNLTDTDINQYKDSYDNFAWFVSYAPAEKPEIAVVALVVQGGTGGFAGPIVRDVLAEYFNLNETQEDVSTTTDIE